MPRCYMVKKALSNKYINRVARGFKIRSRGRSTPSPTNVQTPVSPLEDNPYPVSLQDIRLSEGKEELPASIETSTTQLQRVQDVVKNTIDHCTGTSVEESPKIFCTLQRVQDVAENTIDHCTGTSAEESPKIFCTLQRVQEVKENAVDHCTQTSEENSPKIHLQRVQDVIENAIDQCTEISEEKSPKKRRQRIRAVKKNSIDNCTETLAKKSPTIHLPRVQDVIENAIDHCTGITVEESPKLFCTLQRVQNVKEIAVDHCAETSEENSPNIRLQRIQDVIENAIDHCTGTSVEESPKIFCTLQRVQEAKENAVDHCTQTSEENSPNIHLQRVQDVIESAVDQCTETLEENSSKRRLQRVQDVIENAVDQCTETFRGNSPKRRHQRLQDVIITTIDQSTETSEEKSPKRRLKRVQDVIEDVIEKCNPPVVTTATTVVSSAGTITTTILQPAEFLTSTSPPKETLTRLESARPTKFTDDVRIRQNSPPSPTEGCTSRLEILSPYRNPLSLSERFNRSNFDSPSRSVSISKDYQDTTQEIPLFRDRSAAETEAAHDLLELSRSLPPLPQPSVAIGPHNVIDSPSNDVQEMTVYQPAEQSVYQVNTILASDLTNSGIYQHHQTEIIYEPSTTNATTIIQQTPGGVFIPLSPVQEILFTYSTPSVPTSIITEQTIETVPPLTPPTSECSSDIENNNPNSQPSQRDKEVQTITEQSEVKVAAYTYDTLLVADGRSKNKKAPSQQKDTPEAEPVDSLEVPKAGRYICCECGKQYATSSNLSRHKQTHRSIDSQSAKKCIYCGKAYVSMPALAMHVLTHKLTHSCGICGKMFSRPWLLQGHLRSHTGEKPYGCAHCGKAFADRSNLRAHMQTHSADKNYECPKCRKSFALKSYLNKHLESACQRENGDESSNDVEVSSP